MKTIKDWFIYAIEDEYHWADNALDNLLFINADREVAYLHEALSKGFIWNNTAQGEDYWLDVYNSLIEINVIRDGEQQYQRPSKASFYDREQSGERFVGFEYPYHD